MHNDNDSFFEDKSRSQKKRESTAIQHIGEELSRMSAASLEELPLRPEIMEAILEWQSFKSHEAKRRQMQYIGRILRESGTIDDVITALDERRSGQVQDTKEFHAAEKLREQLLAVDTINLMSALEDIVAVNPGLETGRLKHFLTSYHATENKKVKTRIYRELFRYLRAIVQ